jgi:hypothetical protein
VYGGLVRWTALLPACVGVPAIGNSSSVNRQYVGRQVNVAVAEPMSPTLHNGDLLLSGDNR